MVVFTMLGVIFYVPVVIVWILTFTLGAAAAWKLLRWGARVFFALPQAIVNGGSVPSLAGLFRV